MASEDIGYPDTRLQRRRSQASGLGDAQSPEHPPSTLYPDSNLKLGGILSSSPAPSPGEAADPTFDPHEAARIANAPRTPAVNIKRGSALSHRAKEAVKMASIDVGNGARCLLTRESGEENKDVERIHWLRRATSLEDVRPHHQFSFS